MGREHLLDLSKLAPPEPLQQAVSALDALADGEYLRLLLNRDPIYLYPILVLQGFEHEKRAGTQSIFELLIWHKGDEKARQAALANHGSA
ncbi:MAG: DUF2249 domain-containing protein [Gammaproteobacteria bacterium]|nr:DUF2249 domain-containing protein [Gammaproteobacteria bacterium]